MELFQMKYKSMSFCNDEEGWKRHSPNVMFISRSYTLTDMEYTHFYDVDAYDDKRFHEKEEYSIWRIY